MSIRNSCRFLGNVGREPEIRYTPNGQMMVTFPLAVKRYYQKDEEWQEETTWVDCVVFGPVAERLAKSVGKGTQLVVDTEYNIRKVEQDDGTNRYFHNFRLKDFQVGRGRKEDDGSDYEDDSDSEAEDFDIPF